MGERLSKGGNLPVMTRRSNADAKRYRVLRGGCWSSDAQDCRSAFRDRAEPDFRSHEIGFRICCRGNTSSAT